MPTDGERLAAIEVNTLRILKVLDGNGQPGLIPRFASLETLVEEQAEDIKELRAQPRRGGVAGGVAGGSLTAGLGGAILLVLQRMGVAL